MKFKDVSKNVNYAEIIEMAHVPEYNQFFKSIMDTIENSEMKEVIVEYERKREMYYKLLFEKNKQEYREHYFHWFELSRWREWDWSIILLFPPPPGNVNDEKFLPRDIIDRITDNEVNPDKIHKLEQVNSSELDYKVDLQLVHYSDFQLIGTIKSSEPLLKKPVGLDRVITLKAVFSDLTRVKYNVTYVWCSGNHILGTVIENTDDLNKVKDSGPKDPGTTLPIIKYFLNRMPYCRVDFYKYYLSRMYPRSEPEFKYFKMYLHFYDSYGNIST